jgi:predicted transcriptional regulator
MITYIGILCVYPGMPSCTTVKIDPEVRDRLKELRRHPRESLNDVIARLTRMAFDDEPLGAETIRKIEEGLADIRAGRTQRLEDVMAELDAEDEQAVHR